MNETDLSKCDILLLVYHVQRYYLFSHKGEYKRLGLWGTTYTIQNWYIYTGVKKVKTYNTEHNCTHKICKMKSIKGSKTDTKTQIVTNKHKYEDLNKLQDSERKYMFIL